MRRYSILILTILIPLILVSTALSDDLITARVVGVADGDSITVLTPGNKQVKIRLHGIDCPEGKQAFGKRAKQFTSSQCFGKTIQYREVDTDRYGRTVATVYLDDGLELNLEIIKAGFAWHYSGTLSGRTMLMLRIMPEPLGSGCGLIRSRRHLGIGVGRGVGGLETII